MSANSPAPANADIPNPAGELDRGLEIAGFGWHTLKLCSILYMLLLSSNMELIGGSIVLPAAKCDLNMSDEQRGFVKCIPYIGTFLTGFIHGYLIDSKGRKKMLVYTTVLTGCFSFLSALMPNLICFSICKFLAALCITGPSAIPYTFIAEIVPPRHRDMALAMANMFLTITSAIIPLLGWIILPLDFRIDLGLYVFRSWRLLIMIYAFILITLSCSLVLLPESPKFLLAHGQRDDALKVLQKMYVGNTKKALDTFPIKSLPIAPTANQDESILASFKQHTAPLLTIYYIKYLILNGFLLFGIFSVLNGLYVWVPDLLSRVLSSDIKNKKACYIIMNKFKKQEQTKKCDDSMDPIAFKVQISSLLVCGALAVPIVLSIKYIGKKILLYGTYFIMGVFLIWVNHTTEPRLFATFLALFPFMSLQIGYVNAYSVQIFPTFVRGMAICLTLMLGRLGSVTGNLITANLITRACEAVFYLFGALLLFCGLLTLVCHK